MKLSDYKGEEAIELFAELWEPVREILADERVRQPGKKLSEMIPLICKYQATPLIKIMALLEGEEYETYKEKVNLFTLPRTVFELMNDEGIQTLFSSQGQSDQAESSGSVTENTEESEA